MLVWMRQFQLVTSMSLPSSPMMSSLRNSSFLRSASGNGWPQAEQMSAEICTSSPQLSQTFTGASPLPSPPFLGGCTLVIGPCVATTPAKSRTRQSVLPVCGLMPRPACCRYKPGDIVGLAITSKSMAGWSNPTFKHPTCVIAVIFPDLKSAIDCSRSFFAISPITETADTPRLKRMSRKCSACFTPVAKNIQLFRLLERLITSLIMASLLSDVSTAA